MTDDPSWQSPLSAVAAGLPGALFVVLSVGALLNGIGSACLSTPAGRLIFGIVIAAMSAALVRALWLAAIRAREVRRLVRRSSQPSERLRRIALSCGLEAREVIEDAPICVLAGITSPLVLASTGALAALSDVELRAALHHERAHARRGDQILAGTLSFLVDLLPLPANDLMQTYRTARELAADSVAANEMGAENLAGALLQFAKIGRALVGVSSLVDNRTSIVSKRLQALLGRTDSSRQANIARRVAITAVLATIALAGITAPVLASQHSTSCTLTMKADR
ncbi:MAG: M56 family metallopeptidase [Candidatus Eremiobacteraeota bacterium]|nr:M56 family metallopeptidase [Candidatus Eremiobacteraeota bacterium]